VYTGVQVRRAAWIAPDSLFGMVLAQSDLHLIRRHWINVVSAVFFPGQRRGSWEARLQKALSYMSRMHVQYGTGSCRVPKKTSDKICEIQPRARLSPCPPCMGTYSRRVAQAQGWIPSVSQP